MYDHVYMNYRYFGEVLIFVIEECLCMNMVLRGGNGHMKNLKIIFSVVWYLGNILFMIGRSEKIQ